MQRDASANTPPQGSRGLDVVLACVEEDAILIEGAVLVACVSSRVGVATCSHMNVPLPASCRYEAVPNVLRIEIEIEIVHNNTCKLDRLLSLGPHHFAIQDLLARWARVSSTKDTYRHT
jgi:hypothetical protein